MRTWIVAIVLCALAACSGGERRHAGTVGAYKLGSPYQIKGRWYYPEFDPSYDATGLASWYGAAFDGEDTANGEVFDRRILSAAHPTLPLPSIVRVTNMRNGRTLDVRVNDRGPFIGERLIDLSQAAARRLGFEDDGLAPVRVRFLRLADGRGTPPSPGARRARGELRPTVAAAQPAVARPVAAPAAVRVASMPAVCAPGPQFVQVGAFPDGPAAHRAVMQLGEVGQVVIDPVFAGGRALARIRMGPVATRAVALGVLERVQALGYRQATLVPADGGRASSARC